MPLLTMDITSELLPNPLYHPLPPSVDDLVTYADEMDYEGHLLTFEWADYEIKNHLFGYVRVGLAAEKVRFYRLYRGRFKDFRDYCEKGLGRSLWMVNRLIDAAKVVMELVRAGFTQLPTCESQARPLRRSGCILRKRYQKPVWDITIVPSWKTYLLAWNVTTNNWQLVGCLAWKDPDHDSIIEKIEATIGRKIN